MSFAALFDKPHALPTVPKVAQQLIHSFIRDDVGTDEIAEQLSADPVLSAKTLRLANSAYFHVSRRVATVDDALRMLGFVMVRNLVVGSELAGAFKAVPGLDLQQFWRHSLYTACGARWLAQHNGDNADLAFTVGLVHGLGHLVMHAAAPEKMKSLAEACHPLAAGRAKFERAELGYDHGAVGAELASRWKFPTEISDPLRATPDPLRSDPPSNIGALVHIAAWRSRVDVLKLDDAQAQQASPADVGRAVGLSLAWLPELETMGGVHCALMPPMPPLAELTRGLEAMLG